VAERQHARGLVDTSVGRMADLLIAATAVSARLPLYTRNPKDCAHLEKIATIVPVDVRPSG